MFDWDEHNTAHIDAHGLSQEEVEDAILDPRRVSTSVYNLDDEERRGIIGATIAGRILFVVVTRRNDLLRVVTAREVNEREKRRYRKKGK